MDYIIDHHAETDGLYVTYFLIGHQKGRRRAFGECLEPGESKMTIYLLAMRQGLVMYTAMMVWPFETVFDVIDDELERRGVVPED